MGIFSKIGGFFKHLFVGERPVTKRTTAHDPALIWDPTIGFLNLMGSEGEKLAEIDQKALSPLFDWTEASTGNVPKCEVLFLYCTFDEEGRIIGCSHSLMELVKQAGAFVAVVASECDHQSVVKAFVQRTGWQANICAISNRKGDFPSFFVELFEKMFEGRSMQMAWVDLGPLLPVRYGPAEAPFIPENRLASTVLVDDYPLVPTTLMLIGAWHIAFARRANALACSIPRYLDAPSMAMEERIAQEIKDLILKYCARQCAVVTAKEAIAAMAAVTGDRCIDSAFNFSSRGHPLVVGQRVLSDVLNKPLIGDIGPDRVTTNSVFGIIRDHLTGSTFQKEHFPAIEEIARGFVSRMGEPAHWGKVPLSFPEEDWPKLLPLRVAFDTRADIDAAVQELGEDKGWILRACAIAMALVLKDSSLPNQLGPSVALTLAFEMINGMTKTAPMVGHAIDNPPQQMKVKAHELAVIEIDWDKQKPMKGRRSSPVTSIDTWKLDSAGTT